MPSMNVNQLAFTEDGISLGYVTISQVQWLNTTGMYGLSLWAVFSA